jgi:hypothetical protein
LWPLETPSFEENKLLYECKVLWNKIVKGIKIFVFKSFSIVYDCVKFMVEKWCGTIVPHNIERWNDICVNKNINFHRYVINIHSFSLILIYWFTSFGYVTKTQVYVIYVMKFNFVNKILLKKKRTIFFVLKCEMQSDLFIFESWTKVITWVKEVQFVAM